MTVAAAEQTRYIPAPRGSGRWFGGGGTLIPVGRVHAAEHGEVLCGVDDDVDQILPTLPWHATAKTYERCTSCVNIARSRTA